LAGLDNAASALDTTIEWLGLSGLNPMEIIRKFRATDPLMDGSVTPDWVFDQRYRGTAALSWIHQMVGEDP